MIQVFVNGTLRKAQENHCLIEHYVKDIRAARMQGILYDLGPFPAMIPGDGWVT